MWSKNCHGRHRLAHAELRVLVQDEFRTYCVMSASIAARSHGMGEVARRRHRRGLTAKTAGAAGYASIALNAAIQPSRQRRHPISGCCLRASQRAVLRGPRLEAIRGRNLRRSARRAGSLRSDRALRVSPQAHAAARRHRPVRPALVTGLDQYSLECGVAQI